MTGDNRKPRSPLRDALGWALATGVGIPVAFLCLYPPVCALLSDRYGVFRDLPQDLIAALMAAGVLAPVVGVIRYRVARREKAA
jgi:hypothetical protein